MFYSGQAFEFHEDIKILLVWYSWIHIKGTLSVHSLNGDYLSIPRNLFHEIPNVCTVPGNGLRWTGWDLAALAREETPASNSSFFWKKSMKKLRNYTKKNIHIYFALSLKWNCLIFLMVCNVLLFLLLLLVLKHC